jgi:hypothetical protein
MITVLTGCDNAKYMASRICKAPGVSASTMPSQECFCCSSGGGFQVARRQPRAGTFIPMMPICRSTASGSRAASLTIADNASGSPQIVSLTGPGPRARAPSQAPACRHAQYRNA